MEGIEKYLETSKEIFKQLNEASDSSKIEILRNLTFEQKVGIWLNNYINCLLLEIYDLNDTNNDLNQVIEALKIIKRLAKMHTTVPLIMPSIYLSSDIESVQVLTQMCTFKETTFYRMSNYKGELFIYNIRKTALVKENKSV